MNSSPCNLNIYGYVLRRTWPLIKFCKASSSKIPYVQGPFESILTFSIVSPFDFEQAWTRASLMDSIVTKNLRLRLLDPVELTIARSRSSRSSNKAQKDNGRRISWVLRRRRPLTSSPSLIHPVEQNPATSTRWGW
jgi:hypothetical protein